MQRPGKRQQAERQKRASVQLTPVVLYVSGVASGIIVAILIVSWISSEEFKNYAAGLQSIATILALLLGGIWTYRRFIQFRESKPKIDLNLEVTFIRNQDSQWIITVAALLENKSKWSALTANNLMNKAKNEFQEAIKVVAVPKIALKEAPLSNDQ
jgi:hypothetical protein